jgi:predicted acylesterase/phospholipase RssA
LNFEPKEREMPKKKVAIVLSGGTSLGSYIAGALEELMAAFASSDDYEIDILTGASAGATTAAIIAHGLLYRKGKTALEDVWVRKIDILDLLDRDIPKSEPLSLLSSRRLKEVAAETLRWDNPQNNGERAPFCAPTLTVAMTLANTTPLPYVSRVKQRTADGQEEFIQYRHSEQETFRLDAQALPGDSTLWDRVSAVARASAAIPLVFPLVPLKRKADDFRQYIHRPSFEGEADFWYYDGGTFNNLPIDLAWYHAQQDPESIEDRTIIVINPWRSGVGAINRSRPEPSVFEQMGGLISAVMRESSAIQFENEVGDRSEQANRTMSPQGDLPGSRAIPGVDRAPVDALNNFALVIPPANAGRLRGNHLHALGAFLDERFREYDFRRGAADARHVALKRMKIAPYDSGKPDSFYQPDDDPELNLDISTYAKLGEIKSKRDPARSIKDSFEEGLKARINAIMRRWDGPGPDFVLDPMIGNFLSNYVVEKLPGLWDM